MLVKAEVKEIILSKGQKGVIVQKGQDRYRIGKVSSSFDFCTATSLRPALP